MPESALAKKLLIKSGMRLRLFEAPDGFGKTLSPLPDGAYIDAAGVDVDFVLLFAASKAALDASWPAALPALKDGGVFWVAFPKGSSKVQTDLSRDRGWDSLNAAGWQLVSLISIDATWSAARIRPLAEK